MKNDLELIRLFDSSRCTFCGWSDPPEMFDYHTSGGAPVCHSCAATILGVDEVPEGNQGEGQYQSGTLRLVDHQGNTCFADGTKVLPDTSWWDSDK